MIQCIIDRNMVIAFASGKMNAEISFAEYNTITSSSLNKYATDAWPVHAYLHCDRQSANPEFTPNPER